MHERKDPSQRPELRPPDHSGGTNCRVATTPHGDWTRATNPPQVTPRAILRIIAHSPVDRTVSKGGATRSGSPQRATAYSTVDANVNSHFLNPQPPLPPVRLGGPPSLLRWW
jgi:hypothetical protein